MIDKSSVPQITFIGPNQQWRIEKKEFRHMYDLPAKPVHTWLEPLHVLHPQVQGINFSPEIKKKMGQMVELTESTAIVENCPIDGFVSATMQRPWW